MPAEHERPREPSDGRLARRAAVRVAQDTLRPHSSGDPLLPRRLGDTRGRYVYGVELLFPSLPLFLSPPFFSRSLSLLFPLLFYMAPGNVRVFFHRCFFSDVR